MRNGKMVNCFICKKEFYINPSRFKNSTHTCSLECAGKAASIKRSQKIETLCEVCSKNIFYKKSHFDKIKHKTCSRKCRGILISKIYGGDNNPRALGLSKEDRFFHDRCLDYRSRAFYKNIEFNLTPKFLKQLFYDQKGLCSYSGLPMKTETIRKNKKSVDYDIASLDRIDSNKGYTQDNVTFCLNCVNMLKAAHSMNDIQNVFEAFYKKEHSMTINVKKIHEDSQLPNKVDPNAAGIDLYVHHIEDCGHYIKVHTGVAIQPVGHYWFMLTVRSSTHKKGMILYNNIGIIDMNYTGEIIGLLLKTDNYQEPQKGDRLLQLIPQQQIYTALEEVQELSETKRGSGGFGSSGT